MASSYRTWISTAEQIFSAKNEDGKAASEKATMSPLIGKRIRLFHNEVSRWTQSDVAQQSEHIKKMEMMVATLKESLLKEVMDATKLRSLMRQLVAALSPPRSLPQNDSGEPLDVSAEERLKMTSAAQKSIRRMLVWSLDTWKNLNLETDQIQHLLTHLGKLTLGWDIHTCCARNQWASIKSMLANISSEDPLSEALSELSTITMRTGVPHANAASTTLNDEYTPNEALRSLPCVRQINGRPVELQCAKCCKTIISKWWFCYNNEQKIMLPNNGHYACNAPYRPNKDIPYKADAPNTFPCEHGFHYKFNCSQCGGYRAAGVKRRRDEYQAN